MEFNQNTLDIPRDPVKMASQHSLGEKLKEKNRVQKREIF